MQPGAISDGGGYSRPRMGPARLGVTALKEVILVNVGHSGAHQERMLESAHVAGVERVAREKRDPALVKPR